MAKPVSVLISDVHYDLSTLPLADAAMRQAITKANSLGVQLWVCGDLHNTKANMRAECLNALIKTLMMADKKPRILVGNHDRINEKSQEHALTVLDGFYGEIIDRPNRSANGVYFIPYHSDIVELRAYLSTIPKNSTLVMHQGITGSNMGDYVIDKSAINPLDVAGHRVISGHYHSRQTIKLPDGGTWDYVGNPFSASYGEANDPEKGFQILMDDGSLEFVPTNLRKHIIFDCTPETFQYLTLSSLCKGDLLWTKFRGTKEQLRTVNKEYVSRLLDLDTFGDFRLDLIPTDTVTTAPNNVAPLSRSDLLDSLIDSLSDTSTERKERLKGLWKTLV